MFTSAEIGRIDAIENNLDNSGLAFMVKHQVESLLEVFDFKKKKEFIIS